MRSIREAAFKDCKNLKSVILPKFLMVIGLEVFRKCEKLTSITIPHGVTRIGCSAFCECTSLESIDIPDTVNHIGLLAFDGCIALSSIKIPSATYLISQYAFSKCLALTSVTIPENVEYVGAGAFAHCSNLKNIVVPPPTNIYSTSFKNCQSPAWAVTPYVSFRINNMPRRVLAMNDLFNHQIKPFRSYSTNYHILIFRNANIPQELIDIIFRFMVDKTMLFHSQNIY